MPLLSTIGEKVYRCPLSSDYTSAQTASLGFHLDRYQFPHWQSGRDPSSPQQPTSSSSSSSPNSNPKLRPRSREDWSPAAGHYLGLDSHSEHAVPINKQSDLTDEDPNTDNALSGRSKKSQYEPLDLSVRPESVTSQSGMSPAVLVHMSGVFSNGLSSTLRRLQSYSNAAPELSVKSTYECGLLMQATKEKMQNASSTGQNGEGEFEKSALNQEREDENANAAKWKIIENNDIEPEEPGQVTADFQGPSEKHDKPGLWARAVAESPVSSLEDLTPGQANLLQHQGSLLSYLRSHGNRDNTPTSTHKASLNGRATVEKDVLGEHQLCIF